MFFTKKIKKWIAVFRGEVAPLLILLSTALGFWFGLTPGFYGLHVFLLAVALVLNIHFGLFLLFAGLGKALALAAAPLLYHTGVWMHGSMSGLIDLLAAIPIIGVTDTSRYAVLGALLLGPLGGIIAGVLLSQLVAAFRKSWLKLEEKSEAFKAFRAKAWVRWLDWLLIGKSTKDVRAVLTRKTKLVRMPGVVLAVVLVVGAGIAAQFASNRVVHDYAQASLTGANGAQVDLGALDLRLLRGSVSVSDIAVTDPENAGRNRFAAAKLAAGINLLDLSRGRLVLDRIEISQAAFDSPRATPGKLLERSSKQDSPGVFDPKRYSDVTLDAATLDTYLEDGRKLKEWLAHIGEWLPSPERKGDEDAPPRVPETYPAYLRARSATPPAPRILVRELTLEPIAAPYEEFGVGRIVARNLNDAPARSRLPIEIAWSTNSGSATLRALLDYATEHRATIQATFSKLDLATLQKRMRKANALRFERGTATAEVSGSLTREAIDLSIRVRLDDLAARPGGAAMFGLDPKVVGEALKLLSSLETTVRVVGPLSEPRVSFDGVGLSKTFRDALVKAGKAELARRIDDALGDQLPAGVPSAKEVLDDPLSAAKKGIADLPGLLNKPGKSDAQDASGKPAKKSAAEGKPPRKKPSLADLKKRLKKPAKKPSATTKPVKKKPSLADLKKRLKKPKKP